MNFKISFQKYGERAPAYRYYRLVMIGNSGNSYIGVSELKLLDSVTGENVAVGGVASASSYYKDYNRFLANHHTANKAFDNNYTTHWGTDVAISGNEEWCTLQYNLPTAKSINKYSIATPASDMGPKKWELHGSNSDYFATFEVLDRRENITDWVIDSPREFLIPNYNITDVWGDWSLYEVNAGKISTKVESENIGQAGVVVYDSYDVEFLFSEFVNGIPNPVFAAFNTDLDALSLPRFYFKVEAIMPSNLEPPQVALITSGGKRIITSAGTEVGAIIDKYAYQNRFYGICDFSSIKYKTYIDNNGEIIPTITFSIMDKLSALTAIEKYASPRAFTKLYDAVDAIYPDKNVNAVVFCATREVIDGNDINIPDLPRTWDVILSSTDDYGGGGGIINQSTRLFLPGDLIRFCPMDSTWIGVTWLVIKSRLRGEDYIRKGEGANNASVTRIEVAPYSSLGGEGTLLYTDRTNWINGRGSMNSPLGWNGYNNIMFNWGVPGIENEANYVDHAYLRSEMNRTNNGIQDMQGIGILSKEYGGIDFGIYDGYEDHISLRSFDALALIEAFVKQRWYDLRYINKLIDDNGNPITEFRLPLSDYELLLDEYPLGQQPLDALVTLGKSLQAWIYIDKDGNMVFENRNSTKLRAINDYHVIDVQKISDSEKSRFWDKIKDEVQVAVTSWFPSLAPSTDASGYISYAWDGTYLNGAGSVLKVVGMKSRESMSVNVLIDTITMDRYGITYADGHLHWDGVIGHGLFGSANNYTNAPIPAIPEDDATMRDILVMNMYGNQIAGDFFDFYGKRHASYLLTILGLTWDMVTWQIMDVFKLLGIDYFATKVEIDEDKRSVTLELVEIEGHDYGIKNVVFGLGDNSSTGSGGSIGNTTVNAKNNSNVLTSSTATNGNNKTLALSNTIINSYGQLDASQLDDDDTLVKKTIDDNEVFIPQSPAELRNMIEVQKMNEGDNTNIYPKWDGVDKVVFQSIGQLKDEINIPEVISEVLSETIALIQTNIGFLLLSSTKDYFNIFNPTTDEEDIMSLVNNLQALLSVLQLQLDESELFKPEIVFNIFNPGDIRAFVDLGFINIKIKDIQDQLVVLQADLDSDISSISGNVTGLQNRTGALEADINGILLTENNFIDIFNPTNLQAGIKGDAGIQGEVGDTGSAGAKGDTGETGLQGIQGIQGIQGVKGDTGDTADVDYLLLTESNYFDIFNPTNLQAGIKGETGDQGIQGAKGDSGDQGVQGIQGVQGDQGIQGAAGEKGDKGDKGDTGEQGTSGTNGTNGDQGVQGIQGSQGIQGVKGDTGEKGDAGLTTEDVNAMVLAKVNEIFSLNIFNPIGV